MSKENKGSAKNLSPVCKELGVNDNLLMQTVIIKKDAERRKQLETLKMIENFRPC